jgi:capsular polysaccharide biosynthesis protein
VASSIGTLAHNRLFVTRYARVIHYTHKVNDGRCGWVGMFASSIALHWAIAVVTGDNADHVGSATGKSLVDRQATVRHYSHRNEW